MATRWAVATGNWSNPATWNGGTLPDAADDVYADGKTVTIDMSVTVLTIRTTQRSGGTTGGGFVLNAGVTFTATNPLESGGGILTASQPALKYSDNSGVSTLVADLYSNSGSYYRVLDVIGTGTLNVIGNIRPGGTAHIININNAATVNLTGNILAGSVAYHGISITAPASVNITGRVDGGNNTGGVGVSVASSSAQVVITGPVTGILSLGVTSAVASTITVTGPLTASPASPALSSSHISAINKLSGPFINTEGTMAVYAQKMYLMDTTANRWEFTTDVGTQRNLYSADTLGGNPAVADVRLHTTYGPANELTGVCAVPPAASVSYGVPVDQTTGTALLDASAIASALNASTLAADVGTLQSDVSEISARILEQAPEEGPAVVIPSPSEPTMTTAYIYCFDEHGLPEEGVIIQIRLRALGTGLDGLAFDTARIEVLSNSDGLATAEIPRGASLQFQARRGTTGSWTTFTGANTETLELPALLGHE